MRDGVKTMNKKEEGTISIREVLSRVVGTLERKQDVQALVLFGSVARGEEQENSDIDLWVLKDTEYLVRRHKIVEGTTVEMWEVSVETTEKLISGCDAPAVTALSEGRILFDKGLDLYRLKEKAEEIYSRGPDYPRPGDERELLRRARLTDMIKDAEDVKADREQFNFVCCELIAELSHLLYEISGNWRTARKRLLADLDAKLPEAAFYLRKSLDNRSAPKQRLESLGWLVDYVLEPCGGRMEGDCVLMKRTMET